MNGKYFSITSLHKFEKPVSIKEEMIKDVIITYWPFQESDTLIMPFYRFCIEFPDYKQDNGLNRYSYFYVFSQNIFQMILFGGMNFKRLYLFRVFVFFIQIRSLHRRIRTYGNTPF